MGKKTQKAYFEPSPVALRHPKTDLLILARLLRDEGTKQFQDEQHVADAFKTLVRWADMEVSGRLAEFNEKQLQGMFLTEVFGQALGYSLPTEGSETWNLEQEFHIGPDQVPDAVLGKFRQGEQRVPMVVVELKGPKVHLDRDRSNGRTAVDQCWDYLVNTPPTCRWGIVSNIVSFRLYERDSTKKKYEHFTLQELRDWPAFRRFYAIFHRQGLVIPVINEELRAVRLLKATNTRQREVSDQLYDAYSERRTELISHLHNERGYSVDEAIKYGQLLLDRVVFIAFCEDRGLLPGETIKKAYEQIPAFSQVTNPRWQNFKALFRFIDLGRPAGNGDHREAIPAYNGGLFRESPADDLNLDDRWTNFFHWMGEFNFGDEVNLDVLGHLFERSITELEKLREVGMFGDAEKAEQFAQMPQSVKRKQLGIYYTPEELTSRIVQYTVGELIVERFADAAVKYGVKRADALRNILPEDVAFWRECLAILRDLKVVDPACGSGAFLFQAYNELEARYQEVIGHLEHAGQKDAAELERQIPYFILNDNLYGVDLSPEAVEITQLALWIRSATREQTLATLSKNIVHGNSLVHDPSVHSDGFDWKVKFSEVFDREEGGFDCVIGNPPWERIKLQEREFFSLPAPEIATATNAAKRRQLVAKLETEDPPLYERYQQALADADALLTYCRRSGEYSLTGRGDINTYAVFSELAFNLVKTNGRVGFLVPTALTTTKTTKEFFAGLVKSKRLFRLYDFSNRKAIFADLERRQNFCIICFGGTDCTTEKADYVFRSLSTDELDDPKRHVRLPSDCISLVNPNTGTAPVFKSEADAQLTYNIYRRVPVLINKGRRKTGNPWGIEFKTLFHQTNDAESFLEAPELEKQGYALTGNSWKMGIAGHTCYPVYEAKMCRPYDHRHGSVVVNQRAWYMQGRSALTTPVQHADPEFLVMPRYWVKAEEFSEKARIVRPFFLAFRDVARNDDTRTFLANLIPYTAATNKLPLIITTEPALRELCLLGNLCSFVFDYVVRQKLGDVSVNFFYVEQFPTLTPDTYAKKCPWRKSQTLETWISERVLKLTCTAEDMLPLAEACDFTLGSFQKEYGGRLNKWDEAERATLMAELDAAYFHLYGIDRDDAEYILSTFKGIHEERPLLGDKRSTADHILALYDEYARP